MVDQWWMSTEKALFLNPFLTKRRINYTYMKLQYKYTSNVKQMTSQKSVTQTKKVQIPTEFYGSRTYKHRPQ